jgi:hypothetical protein
MSMMIKITHLSVAGPLALNLVFSDGSRARWDADAIVARDTVMTRPLTDPAYFARAFIEGGALAWPNGLEFSAFALHQRLKEAGGLTKAAA